MRHEPDEPRWVGFTPAQIDDLKFLDQIGNNGWARNSQTEELMPKILGRLAASGASIDIVEQAMAEIGYDKYDLRELERWERKRTTGRFGR